MELAVETLKEDPHSLSVSLSRETVTCYISESPESRGCCRVVVTAFDHLTTILQPGTKPLETAYTMLQEALYEGLALNENGETILKLFSQLYNAHFNLKNTSFNPVDPLLYGRWKEKSAYSFCRKVWRLLFNIKKAVLFSWSFVGKTGYHLEHFGEFDAFTLKQVRPNHGDREILVSISSHWKTQKISLCDRDLEGSEYKFLDGWATEEAS